MNVKTRYSLVGLGILLVFTLRAQASIQAAYDALMLFVQNLLPVLLPVALGAQFFTAGTARPGVIRTLGVGLLCGTPAGSLAVVQATPYIPSKLIIPLAVICSSLSPPFLLGTMPQMVNFAAAAPVFALSVYAAGLIIAAAAAGYTAAFRPALPHPYRLQTTAENTQSPMALVASAARSMALAGVVTVVCSGVIGGLDSLGATRPIVNGLGLLLKQLHLSPGLADGLLKGMFDVSTGLQAVAGCAAPLGQRLALMAGLAAFGGLPIVLQQVLLLGQCGIALGRWLALKAACGLVAGVIAWAMVCGLRLPVVSAPAEPLLGVLPYCGCLGVGLWVLWAAGLPFQGKKNRPQGKACGRR